MAKLSARGRVKVAQVSKEKYLSLQDDETCSYRRKTFALMSDNTILEKDDVTFRASGYSQAYKHTWGWKVKGKLKEGKTKEDFIDLYTKSGFVESK